MMAGQQHDNNTTTHVISQTWGRRL